MSEPIKPNQLLLASGKVVTFEFDIKMSKQSGDIVIVILDIPKDIMMTENVYGVSQNGIILWQIEKTPETSGSITCCYMDFGSACEKNVVSIGNWNGWQVQVDTTNGCILRKFWLK